MNGSTSDVGRLLAARDATTSRRVVFIEGSSGRSATWREMQRTAASWRARRGLLPARVGLAVAHPVVAAASFLAALAADVTVAPLEAGAPTAQLLEQAAQLGLGALVTDRTDDELVDAASEAGMDLWTADVGRLDLRRRRRGAGRSAPAGGAAVIMATSGTTGRPKIVPLTERQLLATATAVADHHRIAPDDRGYCPLPLFHINGLVVGVLSTLVAGSSLVLDQRFSRRSFWPTVTRYGVSWLNLVPAIIGVLAQSEATDGAVRKQVRFARSAAAPLRVATAALFEQRCGVAVLETYGMTEAASQITANPLHAANRRTGSVGLPVGVALRIVDESRRPVPAGTEGGVEIRGETVVSEYWALGDVEPAAWPATDGDGWLATGDVGTVDDEGFLYLIARADDVINRGGEKIYPGEIEDVLLGDERITGAVVVGRPHEIAGAEPVALVTARVARGDRAPLVEDLQRRCAQVLGRSKRPTDVTVVDILPAGPTGKLRRSELRRQLAAGAR